MFQFYVLWKDLRENINIVEEVNINLNFAFPCKRHWSIWRAFHLLSFHEILVYFWEIYESLLVRISFVLSAFSLLVVCWPFYFLNWEHILNVLIYRLLLLFVQCFLIVNFDISIVLAYGALKLSCQTLFRFFKPSWWALLIATPLLSLRFENCLSRIPLSLIRILLKINGIKCFSW